MRHLINIIMQGPNKDALEILACAKIIFEARASRQMKWKCEATGTVVPHDNVAPPVARISGIAYGSNEDQACREAKRAANKKAPLGTHLRHLDCKCEKLR